MDQINKEVIDKVLNTYESIRKILYEIKEEICTRNKKTEEELSTVHIINEFFTHLENERGRIECASADGNK